MGQPLFTRKEKLLLLIMATIQFNHIVDFMILMPLGVKLMPLFQITPKEFGILVSVYTFSAAISGFLTSLIMDRFDRKKVLVYFFLGFTVGTLACALSPTYQFLFFARALTGLFGGVLNSLVLSIVSDAIPFEKRGTALGIVSTAFSFASIVGVPLSLYLANRWSWHSPFLFLGGLSAVVLALIIYGVPSQKHHVRPRLHNTVFEPLIHIVKSPAQLWALLFTALLILSQFTVIPFLSPSLVANAGLNESQLPFIYLVGGGLTILTGPWIGRLADRHGKRTVFRWAMISSMVPIILITHMSVTPIVLILMTTGLFFVTVGGRMVPAMTMISAAALPEYRGSFMSVVSCIQQLAAAMAATLAGFIISRNEAGQLLNYPWVGLVALVFSVLSLLAARKLVFVEVKNG